MWRAFNLPTPEAMLASCHSRNDEWQGHPFWHAEALSSNGRLLFVHFQNLLVSRRSGTLAGLMSGIGVHEFDANNKIKRCGLGQVELFVTAGSACMIMAYKLLHRLLLLTCICSSINYVFDNHP